MKERLDRSIAAAKAALTSKSTRYKNVFSSDEGKFVLSELYRFCGMDRPSYVEGCPDRTAYNEGLKRAALHIKGVLKQSNADIDKLLNTYQKSVNYDPYNQ